MASWQQRLSKADLDSRNNTMNWQTVLLFLIAFRICNTLVIRTFFQPDEYFQSLEPAWKLAFGNDSGAWITWEWREHLRSSLHPFLFSVVYKTAEMVSSTLNVAPSQKVEFLVASPKVFQAVLAASTDFFTWRLAEKLYGHGDRSAIVTLIITILSPWQWFCSTRTLSNCLETTLTSAALYCWPWQEVFHNSHDNTTRLGHMRLSICLAAFASILRPTNLIIWFVITLGSLYLAAQSVPNAVHQKTFVLIRELMLCGSGILAISAISDRSFYGQWTFPPLRFLHFNIVQSLAVFYGRNRPDYYLTEGLPLLLTTALPFALMGLWSALRGRAFIGSHHNGRDSLPARVQAFSFGSTVVMMVCTLSLISHKEVRFIYPLLPIMHVLAGREVLRVFGRRFPIRKTILFCLLAVNLVLAIYSSLVHQRGVIDVLDYLRQEYQEILPTIDSRIQSNVTVGFLMPCHSTPWRSHLVWPNIDAWALTCEPPLDVPMTERAAYLDEADQFYKDPKAWLTEHMAPLRGSNVNSEQRPWPEFVVFFEQLESTMKEHLQASSYHECWRGFNSHFHDDWRRNGDVIVWCISE